MLKILLIIIKGENMENKTYDFTEVGYLLRGVLNRSNGQTIVPLLYHYVSIWDKAIEVLKDFCHGAYNFVGKLIVPVEFDAIYFYDSFIEVERQGKHGAYDYDGNLIIPVIYDSIIWYDKVIVVVLDDTYGAYNLLGKLIVQAKYAEVDVISDIIVVDCYVSYGAYNLEGDLIVPEKADSIDVFDNFIVATYEDDIVVVYDKKGKQLFKSLDYDDIQVTKDFFAIEKNLFWQVYDKEGNIVGDIKYKTIYVAEEFINVKLDGHWKVLCECE